MKYKYQQLRLSSLNNNLFHRISSADNIKDAYDKCFKNCKPKRRHFYTDIEKYMRIVSGLISSGDYKVRFRESFILKEGRKERLITPMTFADKVVQEAIIKHCEPIFNRCFIPNTFQSIKGRGIHMASEKIFKSIKILQNCKDLLAKSNKKITKEEKKQYENIEKQEVYFLHTDIKKYYQSIDKHILMEIISKKILCEKTRELIWGCIKERGVVIGANISQFLANMYLYHIDHMFYGLNSGKWNAVKYFRYADDMVFLCRDKATLEWCRDKLQEEITKLKLVHSKVKLAKLPSLLEYKLDKHTPTLDTLGYVFYTDAKHVRDSIKKKLQKAISKGKERSIPSLVGHFKWAHAQNLLRLMGFIKKKGKWKLAYPYQNKKSHIEYVKQLRVERFEEESQEFLEYKKVLPNGDEIIDLEKYELVERNRKCKMERIDKLFEGIDLEDRKNWC